MPLTPQQQNARKVLYQNAVKYNMFQNGTPSFHEFNRRIDNVSDYVDKIANNYRSQGVLNVSGDTLRQKLGAPSARSIHARAVSQMWEKTHPNDYGGKALAEAMKQTAARTGAAPKPTTASSRPIVSYQAPYREGKINNVMGASQQESALYRKAGKQAAQQADQLREAYNTPIVRDNKNNPFYGALTLEQYQQQQQKDLLADPTFQDIANQSAKEIMQGAENEAKGIYDNQGLLDFVRENAVPGAIPSSLDAKRQAISSPEALWEKLNSTGSVDKATQAFLNSGTFDIDKRAKEGGMSKEAYIRDIVAPSMAQAFVKPYEKAMSGKYSVKDYGDYLSRKFADSLIGSLVSSTSLSRKERQLMEQGTAQYEKGLSGWGKAGGTVANLMGQMPEIIGTGAIGGALVEGGTKLMGSQLAKMGASRLGALVANGGNSMLRAASESIGEKALRLGTQFGISTAGGVTSMSGFMSVDGVRREISTGDDPSLSSIAKAWWEGTKEGAKTGVLFGVAGLPGRALTQAAGKIGNNALRAAANTGARALSVATEAGVMTGQEYAAWKNSPHAKDENFDFTSSVINSLAMVATFKGQHLVQDYFPAFSKRLEAYNKANPSNKLTAGQLMVRDFINLFVGKSASPFKVSKNDQNVIELATGKTIQELGASEDGVKEVLTDTNIPWTIRQKVSLGTLNTMDVARPRTVSIQYMQLHKSGKMALIEYDKDNNPIEIHNYSTPDEHAAILGDIQTRRANDDLLGYIGMYRAGLYPSDDRIKYMQSASDKAMADMGFDVKRMGTDPDYLRYVLDIITNERRDEYTQKFHENSQNLPDRADEVVDQFAKDNGMTSDDVWNIVKKDPLKRTEQETSLMQNLSQTMHDDLFRQGELHRNDAQQQGSDAADTVDMMQPDTISMAYASITQQEQQVTDAYNQAFDKIPGLRETIDSLPKDATPEQVVDAITQSPNISAEQKAQAVATVSDLANVKAAKDGFVNRVTQRVGEQAQLDTNTRMLTPTSQLEDSKGNSLAGNMVTISLGEVDENGNPIVYHVKSSGKVRFAEDGSIDRSSLKAETHETQVPSLGVDRSSVEKSFAKPVMVLIDANGNTKTISVDDPRIRLAGVESADDYSQRRVNELTQLVQQAFAVSETPHEPAKGTEEAPSDGKDEQPKSEPLTADEVDKYLRDKSKRVGYYDEKVAKGTFDKAERDNELAEMDKAIADYQKRAAELPDGEDKENILRIIQGVSGLRDIISKIGESKPSTPQDKIYDVVTNGEGNRVMKMPSGDYVPVDEHDFPDYTKASPEDAAAHITHTMGDSGAKFVDNNIKASQKVLDKAQKAKESEATDPYTYQQEEGARQKAIEDAQKMLDHWQKVKNAIAKAKADEAARIKAEEDHKIAVGALGNTITEAKKHNIDTSKMEEVLANKDATTDEVNDARRKLEELIKKAVIEENKKKGLEGVPTIDKDNPADARERGFRNDNGTRIDRQEETDGIEGRESVARFSYKKGDEKKGHMKVIDVSQLQPSHLKGTRNPYFFLDEAQPKDRTDEKSLATEQTHAKNLRPELLTSDGNAYAETAPVVNKRGEVIQGNHRSAVLRRVYEEYPESAAKYKQYLIDHAKEFGIDPEEIKKMEHPVLVNEIDVPDKEAIRLGQMTARDLETGGIRDIDPAATATKLLNNAKFTYKNFVNILLQGDDGSLSISDLIVRNGSDLIKRLNGAGIISDTEAVSAFDKKGSLTPEAKEALRKILLSSLFKGGTADLDKKFDTLPAKTQKAISVTFTRDAKSPDSEKIIKELQTAIEIMYQARQSNPLFAKASTVEDARAAMGVFLSTPDVFTHKYPSEDKDWSNLATELAIRMQALPQKGIQDMFNQIFDKVQAVGDTSMFASEEAKNPKPMTLHDATKQVLGIDAYDAHVRFKDPQIRRETGNLLIDHLREKGYDVDTTDGQEILDKSPEEIEKFSLRQKPAPKKTQKVYKLMRLGDDGKLYPLFIDSSEPVELGKWYDADSPDLDTMKKLSSGVWLIDDNGNAVSLADYNKARGGKADAKYPTKEAIEEAARNGKRWVSIEDKKSSQKRYGGESRAYYNIGINGSGSVSVFAMRPGWHAGSLPTMHQIGKGKARDLRDDRFVWVEGEVPADKDYNAEAQANPDHDIPDHIPTDGYYMKSTNANSKAAQADRMGWYVAGSFKADRIISDKEARDVIDKWNEAHPDKKVDYDFKREGGQEFDGDVNHWLKFFRMHSPDGKEYAVYGFVTKDGKMHVDPMKLNPEVAIHEYGHLWAAQMRKDDPERWKNVVSVINEAAEGKLKPIFDEIKKDDPTLTGDDLAEEVLMRYSGRRGMKRLDDAAREIWNEGKTTNEKEIAKSTLEKVKNAIREFWKGVADKLHIKYKDVDEIADHMLADMLSDDKVKKETKEEGGKGKVKWHDVKLDNGTEIEASKERVERANEVWDAAKDFLDKNPNATVSDLQRHESMGYNLANFVYAHWKELQPKAPSTPPTKQEPNIKDFTKDGSLDEASFRNALSEYYKSLSNKDLQNRWDTEAIKRDLMGDGDGVGIKMDAITKEFADRGYVYNDKTKKFEIPPRTDLGDKPISEKDIDSVKNVDQATKDLAKKFLSGEDKSDDAKAAYDSVYDAVRNPKKSWTDMTDEERAEEMRKHPLRPAEIETYKSDDADMDDMYKMWANDYLNGDHSPQNFLAYSTIYDYVRTHTANGDGNSQSPNKPQLDSTTDSKQPGNGGGQKGQPNQQGGEGDGANPPTNPPREGGGSPVSGEGGPKPVPPTAPESPTSTTDGPRPAGGSGHSGPRTDGDNPPRQGSGSESPTTLDQKRAAANETLNGLKGLLGELGSIRQAYDKKHGKPGGTAKAVEPVSAMLLVAKEVYDRSLGKFMPRNMEEAKLYGKITIAAAKYAYQNLEITSYRFKEWLQGMKDALGDAVKQVFGDVTDEDVERYIASYWDVKYKIGNEIHTIRDWAEKMKAEDLRKQLTMDIEAKRKLQKKAEGTPVKLGDRDNIDQALPFLLPDQREDVYKAEKQLFPEEAKGANNAPDSPDDTFKKENGTSKDNPHTGMLFTNGTGTGKTYTGLGIAKRFIQQGKKRILIVTPSQEKVTDWTDDAKNLGITLHPLVTKDGKGATQDKGKDAVITTFANFRANHTLMEDQFDLVIYDESHKLMESKDGSSTSTTVAHYRLTNRDYNYALERITMGHPLWREEEQLKADFKKRTGIEYDDPSSLMMVDPQKVDMDALLKLNKRLEEIQAEQKKVLPQLKKQAEDAVGKTKVIFLSATPFNTIQNLDYAEGYLFSYGDYEKPHEMEKAEAVRDAAKTSFFRQYFPHSTALNKNGKLKQNVTDSQKAGEEERSFAEHMKSLGSMSGRTLNNGYDYSRDFPTVNVKYSNEFNTAVNNLLQGKYRSLRVAANKVFGDYQTMSVLYETMKVSAIAERLQQHLSLGRKAVIFHRRVSDRKGLASPPFAKVIKLARLMATAQTEDVRNQMMKDIADFVAENRALLDWEQTLDYRMPRQQLRSLFGDAHNYTPDEMRNLNEGVTDMLEPLFNDNNVYQFHASKDKGNEQFNIGTKDDPHLMTAYEIGYEFGSRCFDPEDVGIIDQFSPSKYTENENNGKEESDAHFQRRQKQYKELQDEVRRGVMDNIKERIKNGEIKIDLDDKGKRKRHVGLFAGADSKSDKHSDIQMFNDDNSDMNVIVVQEASGKEGISLHDKTGKHQRVMINLALPQSPIAFIQAEGRIFRVGQKSNAIFEYPLLGIDNELSLWGGRFNGRAGTTENLALGNEARGLREAITRGVLTHTGNVPLESQGLGGKEFDLRDDQRAQGFDAAVKDYRDDLAQGDPINPQDTDAQQPKANEVPNPLGYKMVEWAGLVDGDNVLQPMAGKGNIARYIPSNINSLSMEADGRAYNRLMLLTGAVDTSEGNSGRRTFVKNANFDEESVGNRLYDAILLPPQFDAQGGAKSSAFILAAKHLADSGRLVAIVPDRFDVKSILSTGLSADRLRQLIVRAETKLPDFLSKEFDEPMNAKIVVIDRVERPQMREGIDRTVQKEDWSDVKSMDDLFDKLREAKMPKRIMDPVAKDIKAASVLKKLTTGDLFRSVYPSDDRVNIYMADTAHNRARSSSEYYRLKKDGRSDYDLYYWIGNYRINYDDAKHLKMSYGGLMLYDMARQMQQMDDSTLLKKVFGSVPKSKQAKYVSDARDYCDTIVSFYKKLTGRTENELDRAVKGEDISNKTPVTGGQTFTMDDVRRLFEENNEGDTEEQAMFDKVFSVAKRLGLKVSSFNDEATNTAAYYSQRNELRINAAKWNARQWVDDNGNTVNMSPKVRSQILLHELIHSVTSYALSLDEKGFTIPDKLKSAVDELNELYEKVFHGPEAYKLPSYSKTNVHEFIAEQANPAVREAERKMKLWTKVKKVISDIVNETEKFITKYFTRQDEVLNPETGDLGSIKETTVGNEMDKVLDKFLDSFDENAYRAYIGLAGGRMDNAEVHKVEIGKPNIPTNVTHDDFIKRAGDDGLKSTLGDKAYSDVFRSLYSSIKADDFKEYMKDNLWHNKLDVYKTVGDYLASIADKDGNTDIWQDVQQKINDTLEKNGIKARISLNDARYLAWASSHPTDSANPLAVAKRIAMQDKLLKVNDSQPVDNNGDFADFKPKEITEPQQPETFASYAPSIHPASSQGITSPKPSPTATPQTVNAREAYEKALERASYIWKEAHVDYMQSAQELVKAILHIKNSQLKGALKDNEDFLNGDNQLSSKQKDMADGYTNNIIKPLQKVVRSILPSMGNKKVKDNYMDLQNYMMNKHGLERNRVFYMRDWFKLQYQSTPKSFSAKDDPQDDPSIDTRTPYEKLQDSESEYNDHLTDLRSDLRHGKINLKEFYAEWDDMISNITGETYNAGEHDYSGLTTLYNLGKTYDDAKAIDDVMQTEDMIGQKGVKDLWDWTRQSTQFAVDLERECGTITGAAHARLSTMFDWYVPLRGFDETKAEDVYAYFNEPYNPKDYAGPTIKSAKGRLSRADYHVFAHIGSMTSGTIAHAEHNRMVNQRFLNFVRHNYKVDGKNRLVTELKHWVVKTGTDNNGKPIWEEAFPKIGIDDNGNPIDKTYTSDEVADIVSDFNADMEAKKAKGLAKVVSEKDKIPYKTIQPKNKSQHIVEAYEDGVKHILVVNGNPRAAQAINGQLNPKANDNRALHLMQSLTQKMSQLVTTYSPDFMVRNTFRDAFFAAANNYINEGPNYWRRYAGNYTKIIFSGIGLGKNTSAGLLFYRYRHNSLNPNNKDDMYFKEYMENGGETGWVMNKNVEQWQRTLTKELRSKSSNAIHTAFNALPDLIEFANEHAENLARFATYMTSRKMGRSITRSIRDAKEVSVNFNRKGSGSKAATFKTPKGGELNALFAGSSAQSLRTMFMFYNAGVQGLDTTFKNLRDHPVRTSTAALTFAVLGGLIIPAINAALIARDKNNEEKDPYAELPEYTRRQNICLYVGKGSFATIPLPIELRAMYGIGDMIASHTTMPNLDNGKPVALDAAEELSQALPLDFMGDNYGSPVMSLIPSSVKPFFEAGLPADIIGENGLSQGINKKFSGIPIRRDLSEWNENTPAWQRAYSSTSNAYINFAKWLDKATSDVHSENAKGSVDIDPAQLEHYVASFTGGMGTTANNIGALVHEIAKSGSAKDILTSSHTPMLRTLHYTPTEQNRYYRTRSKWFQYKEEADNFAQDLKALKADGYANPLARAKEISQKESLKAERATIMNNAVKQYNMINKAIKNVDDPQIDAMLRMRLDQIMQNTVDALDAIHAK